MTTNPVPAGRSSPEEAGGRVASLFDANGRMILGLCRYLLRDADEADDATQQTFLSAYRSLLSGNEPRKPAPWLAEIARNECRARIAARMRAPLPLAATIESGGYDPFDSVDQTEVIDQLKAAIAELPDRQREAVVLRDFYGLSYREVATAMTVSVPTVESLLFRARRSLNRRLGGLPRLAQGALTLPLALRDELAQTIPGFDAAAAGLGITGGSAAAAGIATKLATLPATAKVATATTVTAVAVGGVAVTPQISERPSEPAKPPPTSISRPPPPTPQPPKSHVSESAVQIAHRGQPLASSRAPTSAQNQDDAEPELDDDPNEENPQARVSEARENEVEAETETEADAPEAETESARLPSAPPQSPAAETDEPDEEEGDDERPAPQTEDESEREEDEAD